MIRAARSPVLVDAVVPDVRMRDAIVVTAGALTVALAAQVRVPLGFTPVPITGQTLGVALVGASLGATRGGLALLLYLALGLAGSPSASAFLADAEPGLRAMTMF